ncbi:MAG: transglutaminase-like domain-containing protein [Thermodesulfovibrio sp.]|uniref:Transglutaminase n=1 Tax=Thermodesulfovibrio aggregans TaxID=86166 RepID=A0A2J6WQ77_9BACT|nr:MAG: transglutaminase [Thermodesulfovibrio aggregans]
MKKFKILITLIIFVSFLVNAYNAFSKTLILEGSLQSKIQLIQQMRFEVTKPLESLSFRFALPKDFTNKFVSQRIQSLDIKIEPEPEKFEKEIDRYGNHWGIASWRNLYKSVTVTVRFEVFVGSEIKAENSHAEFPLKNIPESERLFLKSTALVQSENPEIIKLSRALTDKATTEYEAVTRILNWVADNVKYTYNPPHFDALWTLKTGKGNCQNFAHLAVALLRASGIPARVVGGISLKESWKIPLGKSFLVQSMGQGGHAWIEIYFSDLGWLSYDPQQSKQFTSTRHIKQTHALESDEVNDTWRASPYLPAYSETVQAKFLFDKIHIAPKASENYPKSYLLSNKMIVKKETELQPAPPPPPPPPSLPKEKVFEFGNMDFPNLVELYQISGDKAMKILDKETAEYVTSKYIYAQAFKVDEPLEIEKISLAMRKFGGDGTVYVDLVYDENSKPGLKGVRSNPVFLESIQKKPGYYWIDFTFPDKVRIEKGRYWIVLRHSGDVIMNWFFIPGNPYGDADDTRSTLKGYRWEDILNYDFVFKVRAKRQ